MNAKSGIHIWSLKKKLQAFINADNGIKFQSGEFNIADFIFQVIAYPNGNRFDNYGSVMIYLKLLRYPSELPYGGIVTVNFRIQCTETCSSNTYIETYMRTNDSKGWSSKNLLLSDLTKESINKITFQIDVKILKIINHNAKITYEAPLKICKNKYALKWIVHDDIINRFQYANNGKWFESGNYSNLFCFKCAPNGYNDKNIGCALLFLQLCALPPNISKMKCKVKLYHVESGTKWSVKKDFSYDNKNAGWTKNKLSYEKLMKFDTITFRAEIEILNLFDLRGTKSIINTGSIYKAKISYDDGSIYKRKSSKIKNKSRRSHTVTNTNKSNPYGGYGSHNFKLYFNDGYKKSIENEKQNQNTQNNNYNNKEEKHESTTSEEDSQDETDAETDELELETMEDIQEQVDFLIKEYKKLVKIIKNLKQKSINNDKIINQLQNDIRLLKGNNINKNHKKPWKPTGDIKTHNKLNSGAGFLEVFGDFTTPIPTTGTTPFSPGQNAPGAESLNTDENNKNNNNKNNNNNGWTTF